MSAKPSQLGIFFGFLLTFLSHFLRTIWFFFPGFLFIILGFLTFTQLPQGQDLIVQSRVSDSFTKLFFILIGLTFWAFTTWYTARFLAYNEEKLFKNASWAATWTPRLLGYTVFTLFGVAISSSMLNIGLYLFCNILIFASISILRGSKKQSKIMYSTGVNSIAIGFVSIGFIVLYVFWSNLSAALISLSVIQLCSLYWVSFRNPTSLIDQDNIEKGFEVKGFVNKTIQCIFNRNVENSSREMNESFFKTEGNLFIVYHCIALFAFIGYGMVVFYVNMGRLIGSFAFVLLAFGILLGISNLISLLSIRIKPKINVHIILIAIVLIVGRWSEPHKVQLIHRDEELNSYNQRDSLVPHLRAWVSEPSRAKIISDKKSEAPFPLFFVIADGGASRSGFWTSIVLSQLHDRTSINNTNDSYFHRHLFCLAGASGGSVGNGTFLSSIIAQQTVPDTQSFTFCKKFLDNDFLTFPLARLLGPELLKPVFNFKWWGDRAQALETSLETAPRNATPPELSMAELMRSDIDCFFRSETYCPPIFCVNVTRMQDSRPALISNIQVDKSIFGARLDVFQKLHLGQGLKVSTSLVLGARFPYFSPAGEIGDSYFVDGGYFDNSGAGPVHEIILELERLKSKYLSSSFKPQPKDSLLILFLKKMRFYVIHTQNTPLKPKMLNKVHPVLNDLAAPVITLAGSYGAQTNVNNSRLETYLREVQPGEPAYLPINLYTSEKDKFPMSWVISESKIESMVRRTREKPLIDSLVNRLNRNQKDKLFFSLKKKQ